MTFKESRSVIVPRSGSDLNPYGPDLQRSTTRTLPGIRPTDVFAGQAILPMCPRPDTHLSYMIDIALTAEFSLAAGGAS